MLHYILRPFHLSPFTFHHSPSIGLSPFIFHLAQLDLSLFLTHSYGCLLASDESFSLGTLHISHFTFPQTRCRSGECREPPHAKRYSGVIYDKQKNPPGDHFMHLMFISRNGEQRPWSRPCRTTIPNYIVHVCMCFRNLNLTILLCESPRGKLGIPIEP